jgi:hypothetical protein
VVRRVCRESEQRDGQGRMGEGLLRWTRGRFTLRRSRRRHTTRLVGLTSINAQRLSAVALVAASPERREWLVWLSPYEHSYCNELLYEWVCLLPASYTRDDIDITTPLHSAHSILRPSMAKAGSPRHYALHALSAQNRRPGSRTSQPRPTNMQPLRLCCHTFIRRTGQSCDPFCDSSSRIFLLMPFHAASHIRQVVAFQ